MWFRFVPKRRASTMTLLFIRFWDLPPGMKFFLNERGLGGCYTKAENPNRRRNAQHFRRGCVWRTRQVKSYAGVYVDKAEWDRHANGLVAEIERRFASAP
ncbi:MAG: hypothetical protein WCV68_00240 [Candidatus Paceibacterota bacterium]